jgi:hypothetical protein
MIVEMDALDRLWRNSRFNIRQFFTFHTFVAPLVKNRKVRSVVNRISNAIFVVDKVCNKYHTEAQSDNITRANN